MTLAQVAGEEVSRQAVHQIESGRARPSPHVLELIAERTAKPVSFFLLAPGGPASGETVADSRELQWLCLEGRFDELEAAAAQLLAMHPKARQEAEIRFWLGRGLFQRSRPDDAVRELRESRRLAEKVADPWLVVECLDWEAGALYLKEDPAAQETAERALSECRQLEPRLPRTEARILEHLGSIHVRNHRIDAAIACYEQAVEAAGAIRDLARMARTYHGLSIAYRERGHLERAAENAHKALSLYQLEQDQVLVARAENELGLLLMQQGQLGAAEEWFGKALAHFDAGKVERVRSHVLLSLAELKLLQGDRAAAQDLTGRGLELAERLDESLARATGYLLRGRVAAAAGDWAGADESFGLALKLLEELGLRERLATAHAEYGRVFEMRGDHRRAAEHWRMAAEIALPKLAVESTA